jgi:hypothetical protein
VAGYKYSPRRDCAACSRINRVNMLVLYVHVCVYVCMCGQAARMATRETGRVFQVTATALTKSVTSGGESGAVQQQ